MADILGRNRMNLLCDHNKNISAARAENKRDDELAPIEQINDRLVSWIIQDEHPWETTIEKLAL